MIAIHLNYYTHEGFCLYYAQGRGRVTSTRRVGGYPRIRSEEPAALIDHPQIGHEVIMIDVNRLKHLHQSPTKVVVPAQPSKFRTAVVTTRLELPSPGPRLRERMLRAAKDNLAQHLRKWLRQERNPPTPTAAPSTRPAQRSACLFSHVTGTGSSLAAARV